MQAIFCLFMLKVKCLFCLNITVLQNKALQVLTKKTQKNLLAEEVVLVYN